MFKQYLNISKKWFQQVKNIVEVWPEFWSVPLALLVWLASPYFIWMIDDQSATFDSGILQIYVYVIVGMMVFNGVVFGGIKFNFPVVFEFYKGEAGEAYKNLTAWQKIIVLLILYVGLFFCCVWLASIMVEPTQRV